MYICLLYNMLRTKFLVAFFYPGVNFQKITKLSMYQSQFDTLQNKHSQ